MADSHEPPKEHFVRLQMGEFWSGDRGLTIISIALIVYIFLILPLHKAGLPGRFVFDCVIVVLMVSGTFTVGKSRVANLLAVLLILTAVGLLWASILYPRPFLQKLHCVFSVAVLLMYVRVVLLIMFRHGPVTWSRIQGGLSAYLLLGLVWASAFELVEQLYPGAFHFVTQPESIDELSTKLIYFSFTTLTTVGFGDVTPVYQIARSLAIAEAIVGQLFPAILIGALVAMAMQFRPKS
jgi:Ion channel